MTKCKIDFEKGLFPDRPEKKCCVCSYPTNPTFCANSKDSMTKSLVQILSMMNCTSIVLNVFRKNSRGFPASFWSINGKPDSFSSLTVFKLMYVHILC